MDNLHPNANIKRRTLENGTVEETHTLPKHEYYASLRMGSNASLARNSNTINRSASNQAISQRFGTMQRSKSNTVVFKPSGKMIDCTVTLLDGTDQTFSIDGASLGQQLIDEVATHLDLAEKQFFGLRYDDKSLRIWFWLRLDKKISEQIGKNNWEFDFQAKFYPPHAENIVEDITRYFFCLQVRQDVVQGVVPVSFNVLVLLCAYAVQSEAGDFDPIEHATIEYLKQIPFAPKVQQTDELLVRVRDLHQAVSFLTPEEADKSFMWNAMKLGMYGVDMHKVKTSTNEEVSVGVFHSGVLVYRGRIRVVRYSWPKILNLSYKNKSFFMKIRATELEKKERVIEFKCTSQKLAKRLWNACKEHHEFFRMIDAENPRKPQLMPGFGTRKYKLNAMGNSMDSTNEPQAPTTPNIILSRPQPKVRRTQTQRREKDSLVTPSGIAPVANNDEIFEIDDSDIQRPDLIDEYWKMTVHDASPEMGIDTDGLDVAAKEGSGWQGCRANRGVKGPGMYYYEGKVVEDGLVRLGWATNEASLDLGRDNLGFGYGDSVAGDRMKDRNGRKRHADKEEPYGEPVHEGDVIGCSIDFDNDRILWNKNGINFGPAYTIPQELQNEAFFPTSSIKDGRVVFNYGDEPLECVPKGDWVPLSKAPADNVVPNFNCGWRINPFDSTKGTDVAGNGMEVQSAMDGQWNGCRSNKGVFDAGKYYFEAIPMEDGLARLGWATDNGSLNLGSDPLGFGYGADEEGFGISGNQSKKMHKGEIDNYGRPFEKGDVVGCYIDLDNKFVKWSKNGEVFGPAYNLPDDLVETRAFYPTASLLNNTLDFNFGDRPFQFYPGTEWIPVCFAANGNTEKSKKIDPAWLNRPQTDRKEDILELRRQERDKLKRSQLDRHQQEQQDRERRQLLLQKQKEEEESRRQRERDRDEADRQAKRMQEMRDKNEQEQRRLMEIQERERQMREEEERQRLMRENETTETEESYQTVEKSDPTVTTETFVDEQGRTVMRTVKKTKVKTTTNVQRNVIERTEDETNRSSIMRIKGNSFYDDDEALLLAILEVTQFNPSVTVMEGVNDLSMTSA